MARSAGFVVITLLVMLTASSGVGALQQLPPAPGTGLVTGQVIDAISRRPVGEAVVALTMPGRGGQPARHSGHIPARHGESRVRPRDRSSRGSA